MKLTNLLFLFAIFNLFGSETYSQYAKLNLNMKDVPIQTVLNAIEGQSEFFFLYSSKMIDVTRKVDINAESKNITEVLSELLTNTDIKYTVKDRQILLVNKSADFTEFSQQNKISGTVTDEKGNPMPGVNIQVEGTTVGTITDVSGKYSLDKPTDNAVLIFSFIGYISQKSSAAGKTSINITLNPELTTLDEVVVVGYGTQSRATLTTSITKLDNKVLANVPYANLGSALQGTLSGVRVQQISGQPGTAPRVIVRGGTSINNPNGAQPLYLVDGVFKDNLSGINSEDIESMQVLKDAAATAIYGARGSNGVVLVTTKSGKLGVTSINYKYDFMISNYY